MTRKNYSLDELYNGESAEEENVESPKQDNVESPEQEKYDQWKFRALVLICVVGLMIASIVGLVLWYERDVPLFVDRTGTIIDCYPGMEIDQGDCEKIGCVWSLYKDQNIPNCRVHGDKGYRFVSESDTSDNLTFVLSHGERTSRFLGDVANVVVVVKYITKDIVRVQIRPELDSADFPEIPDYLQQPYEAPETLFANETNYVINATRGPRFSLKIHRNDSGVTIFDTDVPGLTISKHFLQITTKLPSSNVYGFATTDQLKLDMNWKTVPVFAYGHDGAHPLYMNVESDGKASGVYLRNSHPMEIQFDDHGVNNQPTFVRYGRNVVKLKVALQPDPYPAITYRVLGGILDFYVFIGPTPKDVLSQFTQVVGRPFMPPRWSLGLHLGGHHDNYTELRDLVNRNYDAQIPFEVLHTGSSGPDLIPIEIKSAYGKNISALVSQYKLRYLRTMNAAVEYDTYLTYSAQTKNIFIKDSNNDVFKSMMNTTQVVYPDYTNRGFEGWIKSGFVQLYIDAGKLEPRGLFLDSNQPYSSSVPDCVNNQWNKPAFTPSFGHGLNDHTVCMDAQQYLGRHYSLHNLYGHSQALIVHQYATRLSLGTRHFYRHFTASKSTFSGSQMYAAHWLTNTTASWDSLRMSLRAMLSYSTVGFSMTGTDLCGLSGEADSELCMRWMQLAALSPFTRSYTADYDQPRDPASFDDLTSMRDLLLTRAKLRPYLYTCLYNAHTSGAPFITPLFLEFPSDNKTWGIDEQYLLGPAILISPVLTKGATKVRAYMPPGRWFEYYTGTEIASTGRYVTLDTPLLKTNIHIRGGHIIPFITSDFFEDKPTLGLIVALDSQQKASGQLYWDDGYSTGSLRLSESKYWSFNVADNILHASVASRRPTTKGINRVELLGLPYRPSSIEVNGNMTTDKLVPYKQGYAVTFPTSLTLTMKWDFY